ncbi:MAG: hypothetical protein HEQ39_13450 [Rhizobacter sp.]
MSQPFAPAAATAAPARSPSAHAGRTNEVAGKSMQRDFSQAMQRSLSKREHHKPNDVDTTTHLEWALPCGAMPLGNIAFVGLQETQGDCPSETGQPLPTSAVAMGVNTMQAPRAGAMPNHQPNTHLHSQNNAGARRRLLPADAAPMTSLFDRLVKLIDMSPAHEQRLWRLTIRLNDEVLSGTELCIEVLAGRTELRFTPGSASAARELAAVADLWSQRLSARAGRLVSVRVFPESANNQLGPLTPPLTGEVR